MSDVSIALVGETVPLECFAATDRRVKVPFYAYNVRARPLEEVPIRSREEILSGSPSDFLQFEIREFERTGEGWERIK